MRHIYVDLIFKLAFLVALIVVSGFVDKRLPRDTYAGALTQGLLFGLVAVIGMLQPFNFGPGLIFDGRSFVIALCALFFGPLAAFIAGAMTIVCRIALGGVGALTGSLVIVSSALLGLYARYRFKPSVHPLSVLHLYYLGLAVHAVMLALMFTLPGNLGSDVVKRIGLPIILLYPLTTLFLGKILADQLSSAQTQKALLESEVRHRLLFETSLDAIILTSPNGQIYSVNPAACRMFGGNEEEIVAVGRQGLVDNEDPNLEAALREWEREGKYIAELTFVRKDGSKFTGEVSSSVFLNGRGEAHTSMIIRDVSERRRYEEHLKRLQILFNETQRISRTGGWEFNPATGMLECTDETYNILGVSKDLISRDLGQYASLLVPDDKERLATAFRYVVERGIPYDLELHLITSEGIERWVRTEGRAEWKEGKIVRVYGTFMDVTERKLSEAELSESEELFRNIFHHHAAVMLLLDPKTGNIFDANDAAVTFYGWPKEKLMTMKIQDINTLPPEEVAKAMNKVFDRNRVHFEFSHRLADGSVRDVEVFSSRIDIKGRTLLHSIIIDITSRKRAEKEILRLNKELEWKIEERTRELRDTQLALLNVVDDLNISTKELSVANQSLKAVNKELEAFSYSVSHDLRAPLRSIDGFSQALLEDCADRLDEDGKKYLDRIRRATQHMSQLIDDLLNLSRITKSELNRHEFDLGRIARETVEILKQRYPQSNLTVDIQDNVIVNGDRLLISVVMTNLLDNAWKFTKHCDHPRISFGEIVINGERIFFVRDNGAGFDMNYADKLFGVFQRLHRFDEYPGTGIGLATVQRIINRHGGRIWAESEVNKGATFYFTLPVGV